MNNNIINFECEKYWDFPNSYSKEKKESMILKSIYSDNYIASLKKDGHYNRAVVDWDKNIYMQTRTVSKTTGLPTDKCEHVPHIVETLKKLPAGTILIGELYQPNKKSSDMTSILQCLPNKAVERQSGDYGFVYYYIHDCWYYNGKDLMDTPYEKRIKYVQKIYEKFLAENEYILCAKYATTPDEINKMLEYAWDNNEEGIVMVKKDATVTPGKKTAWKTIKVKKELSKEVDCLLTGRFKSPTKIYTGKELDKWKYWENLKTGSLCYGDYYNDYLQGGVYEPVTKAYYYGWAGSLELGIIHNGEVEHFGYISGISDEVKEDIIKNNDKYINRPCKVTAMEFTDDKKLRHPRFVEFRDDLNTEDCNWEKVFGEV